VRWRGGQNIIEEIEDSSRLVLLGQKSLGTMPHGVDLVVSSTAVGMSLEEASRRIALPDAKNSRFLTGDRSLEQGQPKGFKVHLLSQRDLMFCQCPAITCRFQLLKDLSSDCQLEADVADEMITPALQESSHVSKQPVQAFKRVGIPKRAVPSPFHHL
jgi:hypothetical protein